MSNRSPRYPVTFRVLFDDGRGSMSGPVYDVSESGLFIETPMDIAPGTKVRIAPVLSDDTGLPPIHGVVVRRSPEDMNRGRNPGIGVRFESVDETTLAALHKLFERATWVKP